jgi:hypothetical protein
MDNAELARHSAAFIRPAEPAFRVVAGQSGLDLLVLQFPRLLAQAGMTVPMPCA